MSGRAGRNLTSQQPRRWALARAGRLHASLSFHHLHVSRSHACLLPRGMPAANCSAPCVFKCHALHTQHVARWHVCNLHLSVLPPHAWRACMQVLAQLAQQLAELHAAGYVHRDLKPANVLWLEAESRWAFCDFGCAAIAGRQAPLRFSLAYAAPEVVVNARNPNSDGTMLALPELDAWSIGLMIYETLMGERAFGSKTRTRSEVRAALPCMLSASSAMLRCHACLMRAALPCMRSAPEGALVCTPLC
jgi:serine/threonine protein kinase